MVRPTAIKYPKILLFQTPCWYCWHRFLISSAAQHIPDGVDELVVCRWNFVTSCCQLSNGLFLKNSLIYKDAGDLIRQVWQKNCSTPRICCSFVMHIPHIRGESGRKPLLNNIPAYQLLLVLLSPMNLILFEIIQKRV